MKRDSLGWRELAQYMDKCWRVWTSQWNCGLVRFTVTNFDRLDYHRLFKDMSCVLNSFAISYSTHDFRFGTQHSHLISWWHQVYALDNNWCHCFFAVSWSLLAHTVRSVVLYPCSECSDNVPSGIMGTCTVAGRKDALRCPVCMMNPYWKPYFSDSDSRVT